MPPDKKPFRFRDLLDIFIVNAKVLLSILVFLLVFISIFFGYYSILLIALSMIFVLLVIIDAYIKRNQDKGDLE